MQSTAALARKQFTLNTPQQLEEFAEELNDYEDEDEEYEGDGMYTTEDGEDLEDDDSVLADRLGNFFKGGPDVDLQSPGKEDENLVDLLQQRLFISHEDEDELEETETNEVQLRKSSVTWRKPSSTSSSEEFIQSEYRNSTSRLDQDTQRVLRESFPREREKPLSLSSQKIVQMTTRFRIFEEKKARRLKAKRRETEAQENLEFRFAPTMNTKSRQMVSQFPTFAERQATLLTKKRQQQARLEQQRERELLRDRTLDLQESVKTPCICSHGNTSRSENCVMGSEKELSPSKGAHARFEGAASPADGSRHTQACMRFMAMCSKMNASFAIQRKKELMRRSLDDIIAYQEGKKQRQQARAALAKAREDKETTFTPQINAKSEKIYAALIRSGKLDTETTGRMLKPRKSPPLPPKMTFKPTISRKSKSLLQKKQREQMISSTAGDKSSISAAVDGPISPLPLDVFSRLQQLSSHRETEAYRLQRMREEESLKKKPIIEWNIVQYDAPNCGFILQGFDCPKVLS
ncbi:hypothetical protein JM16_005246 [Phytophthora kernoviae]|uniref:Uncharacterized protein n=1 Tax=Phytophthora kernoviae TaxID=325452 RepID=A0A8T0LPZ1_9STRA|nr:hypothetical protein JM16_005246 [Phytophthora kernoviae]